MKNSVLVSIDIPDGIPATTVGNKAAQLLLSSGFPVTGISVCIDIEQEQSDGTQCSSTDNDAPEEAEEDLPE